jgi:hypothetical protein
LTLVRAEFHSEARLIGFRLESQSLRTKQCSVFELRTARLSFWPLSSLSLSNISHIAVITHDFIFWSDANVLTRLLGSVIYRKITLRWRSMPQSPTRSAKDL